MQASLSSWLTMLLYAIQQNTTRVIMQIYLFIV